MRTEAELIDKLAPHGAADHVYDPAVGYLSWHFSTGQNLETLYMEAAEKRKGYGTELYRMMCRKLLADSTLPYHSVFCYRLGSNEAAKKFYAAMGWAEQNLGQAIYRDDDTVVLWITWADLLRHLGIET